jgi:hypothetical protein
MLVFRVLFGYKQLFSLVWFLFGWCFPLFVWQFCSWWLVPVSVFFGGRFPVLSSVSLWVLVSVVPVVDCQEATRGQSRGSGFESKLLAYLSGGACTACATSYTSRVLGPKWGACAGGIALGLDLARSPLLSSVPCLQYTGVKQGFPYL